MEVRFQNFRCFKDTGRIPIRPITLLVGENSSGKTSFLAGLNHMFGLLNDEGIDLNTAPFEMGSMADIVFSKERAKRGRKTFKYESAIDGISFHWTFVGDLRDPQINEQEIRFSSKNRSVRVRVLPTKVDIDVHLSREEAKQFKAHGGKFVQSVNGDGLYRISTTSLDKGTRATLREWHTNWHTMRSNLLGSGPRVWRICDDLLEAHTSNRKRGRKIAGRLSQKAQRRSPDFWWENFGLTNYSILNNALRSINEVRAFAPLREMPRRAYFFGKADLGEKDPYGNLAPARMMELAKSGYEAHTILNAIEDFGRASGLFKKLEIDFLTEESNYPFAIKVNAIGGRYSNLPDVGYGTSQMLPLLVDILGTRASREFLVQQPEVHLHPRAQAEFASLMAKLAGRRRSFVVETHSDYILDRLTFEIKRGFVQPQDIRILFFEKHTDSVKIHPIELNEFGIPINPPKCYRAFFDAEYEKVWL